MLNSRVSCQLFLIAFLVPTLCSAPGWSFGVADTVGDGSGAELKWPAGEAVPFRFHYRGADDFGPQTLQRLTRASFATWGAVSGANLTFEEGRIFTGPAAHHAGPTEVDGQSAVFFIESNWPFATEVIALTSVSFATDGEILDADIAFNGADHRFTTVDSGGSKDFASIATHEVGHFLGLGHSAEVDATMAAEYENGDIFLRDLAGDDVDGISYLYPCASEPCNGQVLWKERGGGCSSGDGMASLLVIGLGLGALGLRRRRMTITFGGVIVFVLGVGLPGHAVSSLMEEIPIEVLANGADRVVRGTVTETRSVFEDGFVKTYATVLVQENWAGAGGELIQLTIPGGLLDEPVEVIGAGGEPLAKPLAGTLVFGAPRVAEGESVVVFVDGNASGTVRGLSQGLFHVAPDGRLWRDLGGLSFARVGGGRAPLPVAAPERVEDLRAAIRQ